MMTREQELAMYREHYGDTIRIQDDRLRAYVELLELLCDERKLHIAEMRVKTVVEGFLK
jgi:nitrogen-specific signal transduction histidine kinase